MLAALGADERVGMAGLEPAVSWTQTRRPGHTGLHPGRDSRTRTCDFAAPDRAPCQSGPYPVAWRRRESNPLRQRLQGAPAPLAVIPMSSGCPRPAEARQTVNTGTSRLGGPRRCFPLWSYQVASTFPPKGGTPQGRQDLNLRRAVLEAAVLAAELRPYEIQNRPPGVLGAVPSRSLAAATWASPLPWSRAASTGTRTACRARWRDSISTPRSSFPC
jgi:hypothetical protein